MAKFVENTLIHAWYGSDKKDIVGYLKRNTNPSKPQAFIFIADTNDDTFRKYYYEKPTADEVLAAFIDWQNEDY